MKQPKEQQIKEIEPVQQTEISMNPEQPIQQVIEAKEPEPTVKLITTGLNTSNPEQITYNTDELLITLLGGISLQNLDRLRVTIYLRRNPHINAQQSIRQNIDLYQDDMVEKFIRKSAEKLEHGTTLISSAMGQSMDEYRFGWLTYLSISRELPVIPLNFKKEKISNYGNLIQVTCKEPFDESNQEYLEQVRTLVEVFRKAEKYWR